MTLSLDGRSVFQVRLCMPEVGAWFADVSLDTSATMDVPTGRVMLDLRGERLSGTVHPEASGRFGSRVVARVVGGGDGWGREVDGQHFQSDAGVLLSTVVRTTAAAAGESVGEVAEAGLGPDFVRVAGPAGRVLAGRAWYVDDLGVTQVKARTATAAPEGALVAEYDPRTKIASVLSSELVRPGWTFTDTRFATPLVVRDVETVLDASGQRCTAWCSPVPGTPLSSALRATILELSGAVYLRTYRYRVYTRAGDRLNLQIVTPSSGVPDVLPADILPGLPGMRAEVQLGTEVLVVFAEGDPRLPRVIAWEGPRGERWEPERIELHAKKKVAVGDGGAPVVLGGAAWFQAVTAALGALGQPVTAPPPAMSEKLEAE